MLLLKHKGYRLNMLCFVWRNIMKRIYAVFVILLLSFPVMLFSQVREEFINVHFFPQILVHQDTLTDGPDGRSFRISEETFLVWVDLEPDMFFTHDTYYIMISKEDIRIRKGNWWPVLNGKNILLNEQGQYALISPFEMPHSPRNLLPREAIDIYVYPFALTSRDRLQGGPLERLFRIPDHSMLIWVDLLPDAYFAHPTSYILISKQNTWVKHGNWMPVLNGRKILYGRENNVGIISPFKVTQTR